MAITYTVPSPHGTATRKSAGHTLAGKRYHYVTFHVVAHDKVIPATKWCPERRYTAGALLSTTWHSRLDLAQRPDANLTAGVAMPHPVLITDAMCREHGQREATPAQLAAVARQKAQRRAAHEARYPELYAKREG